MRKGILLACSANLFIACNNYANFGDSKFSKRESLTASLNANHQLIWRKIVMEDKSPSHAVMKSYSLSGELIETHETMGSPTEWFAYKNGEFESYVRHVKAGECVIRSTFARHEERERKFCPNLPVSEVSENTKTQVKRTCLLIAGVYRCEDYEKNQLVKAREQILADEYAPWKEFRYSPNGLVQSDFKAIFIVDSKTERQRNFYRRDTVFDYEGNQISRTPWMYDGHFEELEMPNNGESSAYRDKSGDLEYFHSYQKLL